MTEQKEEICKGFSINVATSWEKAYFEFQLHNTLQVALRIAIVLGKNSGVMISLIRLVRFGLGGKQGNGK